MTATSLDLSQIKTDALSSAATFRNLIGLGSSDAVTFKEATLASGTVTSSTPIVNATQTWNDGATTFTGILANITDTASASASLLMDLQVGGSSKFKVDKNGILELGNAVGAGLGTNLPNRISCAFSNSFSFGLSGGNAFRVFGNSVSVIIYSHLSKPITFAAANGFGLVTNAFGGNGVYVFDEAANVWAQRNGTNAQTFRLYNTYTSSTSFERLNVRWATNELIIDAEAGSGGGTLRGIKLGSATTSLLGFYGVTPVDQPLTVADPAGGAIVDSEARTAIGEIIDRLQELGLIA